MLTATLSKDAAVVDRQDGNTLAVKARTASAQVT